MKFLYYCILVLAFVAIWFFYGFLVSVIFDDINTLVLILYVLATFTTCRGVKVVLQILFFKDKK